MAVSRLRRVRRRIPLDRSQLSLLLVLAALLALPISRQTTAEWRLSLIWMPVVWAGLALLLLAALLPLRLLVRRGVAFLQARRPVFRYWLLLRALVVRDLRARYARASLGWVWIVVQPVFQMMVYTALRYILGLTDTAGMNFVVFLYAAILPWNFIVSAVNTSAPAVFANAALLKKMAVPREIFVLSAVLTALADFAVGLAVLTVLVTIFSVPVTWSLLWLPILLAVAVGMGLAVGLIVAAIAPFRGDISLLIPYLMQLWFFLTPIFYSIQALSPAVQFWINLNPVTGLIIGFRNVLGAGAAPDLGPLAWSALFTALLLALGWPFFRHMSQYFADMM